MRLLILFAIYSLPACTSINPDCQVEDGIPFVSHCVIRPKTTKQIREGL